MALTRVERWDVGRDGPPSEMAIQHKIESSGYRIAARVYPAGHVEFPPVHDRICLAGVVRGLLRLTVLGETTFLAPGDLAFVPPGAARSLEVIGPGTALYLEAFPGSASEGEPPAGGLGTGG